MGVRSLILSCGSQGSTFNCCKMGPPSCRPHPTSEGFVGHSHEKMIIQLRNRTLTSLCPGIHSVQDILLRMWQECTPNWRLWESEWPKASSLVKPTQQKPSHRCSKLQWSMCQTQLWYLGRMLPRVPGTNMVPSRHTAQRASSELQAAHELLTHLCSHVAFSNRTREEGILCYPERICDTRRAKGWCSQIRS